MASTVSIDSGDGEALSAESAAIHPLDLEIEFSHGYADPDAFSDDDLTERLLHFIALQEHGELDIGRAAELAIVVERISFEFWRRLHEE